VKNRFDLLSLGLILIAAIRIVSILAILSATTDESVHVAAGIELLQQHRYDLLPANPPLARVIFAAPLIAAGVHFDPQADASNYTGPLFYARGHYRTNLVLARIGNVLFFFIGAIATWRIGRRELGPAGGALTTLLFTTQPLILGFSGIANHDLPLVTGVAASLLAFDRWLETRTSTRAIVFGAAYAFAIATKFSAIPFVPASCAALFVVKLVFNRELRRDWRPVFVGFPLALVTCLVIVWGSYAVTAGPRYFFIGMTELLQIARGGADSYALGQWNHEGWWWYFPFALALKTTLASLLLIACIIVLRRMPSVWIAWLAAAGAILAIALPSKLDLGVRYVLPVFVPLSVVMAAAALAMLHHAIRPVRIAAIGLLVWHCIASLAAHPQYFAYFNEIAGRDPSRFLVDSNLDWGQDVLLLQRELRRQKAESVGLALAGTHDCNRLGFPPNYRISPDAPAGGWVAVSDHMYRSGLRNGGWSWLRGRTYRRVGASIRLYYIGT
jgi:4-amino-4-deoxy-L-arabinose transferase-like glycosyltransferase